MNLWKGCIQGWDKNTHQDYPTIKIWWKRKRQEDYPAPVACTSYRCRVVFMSFSFPPYFCSGVVFCVLLSKPCFHSSLGSSLNLTILYRNFLIPCKPHSKPLCLLQCPHCHIILYIVSSYTTWLPTYPLLFGCEPLWQVTSMGPSVSTMEPSISTMEYTILCANFWYK